MIEFICRTLLILALSSVVILSVINLISSLWHRDKKPGIYNKLLNIRDLIARASGFFNVNRNCSREYYLIYYRFYYPNLYNIKNYIE